MAGTPGVHTSRYIHLKKLKELLGQLPEDSIIRPNELRNLTIWREEPDAFVPVGVIDILWECIRWNSEEEETLNGSV